ncbi:MAG: hypothetical protein ABIH26_07000 [Candidatus Eisenbacteria bacterium]
MRRIFPGHFGPRPWTEVRDQIGGLALEGLRIRPDAGPPVAFSFEAYLDSEQTSLLMSELKSYESETPDYSYSSVEDTQNCITSSTAILRHCGTMPPDLHIEGAVYDPANFLDAMERMFQLKLFFRKREWILNPATGEWDCISQETHPEA